MRYAHHRLRRAMAIIIGIVFLVSGLLKIEDPVGTMLIITEYAKFFHIGFIIPAAKVLGIILATFEASLGIALITGIMRKLAAVLTYALIGFFTIITFILWVKNPAMDCGCFGEAIHLTHGQSLVKNLILLALALIAFTPFQNFGVPKLGKKVAAEIAFVSVLFGVMYSNTHLPPVDFTAFDWGAELFASLDESAMESGAELKYVYQKDGVMESFALADIPAEPGWEFVEVDTSAVTAVNRADNYPILGFRNAEGEYADSIAAEGKVVVFSVYDPGKAHWDRLQRQYHQAEEAGARPLLLVASYPEEVDRFDIPIDLEIFYADYKTLITLNRSNGGGAFFSEGELVNKWPSRDFPKHLEAYFEDDPVRLSTHYIVKRRIRVQGFCVYLAALLILL